MKFGQIYRLEFQTFIGQLVRIDISPTDILIDDSLDPQIFELKGTGKPLVLSTLNNDQEKFQPIRSKQAVIQFRSDSSSGLDINTFSKGADNLWKVDITLPDFVYTLFTGYLILADNQQPFQPDPQVVTLTATDHLGALKDIPLVDYSDINPIGKYRIADLITMCLRKTGLSLQLYVINNLRTGSGQLTRAITFRASDSTILINVASNYFYPGQEIVVSGSVSNDGTLHIKSVNENGDSAVTEESLTGELLTAGVTLTDTISAEHFYEGVWLDAKTFEKAIGESEDCYSVLKKILGEDCFITQWKGSWYIMRIDEFDGNLIYAANFDTDGTFVSIASGTNHSLSIGRNLIKKFANADTSLQFIRPHGFVKETFSLDIAQELPCNKTFERGDLDTTISAYEKTYELDCWTKRRGLPGGYNTPITITDFIKRIFDTNGYEKDRYIYITPQTGHVGFSSTDDEYIESDPIQIQTGDKINASIDWKLDADIASSSGTFRMFRLILIGNDGTNWIVGEDTVGDGIHKWFPVVFTGSPLNTAQGSTGITFADQDETEWQNISWESPPAPVSGDLYIWINQFYQISSTNVNINYANLNLELLLLINGTYTKYTSQYNRVDRLTSGCLAKRDEQVFISDSPHPLIKGSMFIRNNSKFKLAGTWYTAAPLALNPNTDPSFLHPYGYIQAFSVWNQFRGTDDALSRPRGINIFSGSILGLDEERPDLLHKFLLTDANENTNDRYFILLSFSQDWRAGIWTGVFVEVYNTVSGKVYNDTHTFRYISQ